MSDSPATGFDGKTFSARLPTRPGVYLMRDALGEPLYVGKARNLRKRVASYFDARPKGERIMRMVARIAQIEIGLTRSEGEALLLENEWIKSLKPRYNVLLKDDKSYPWIVLTTDHDFPRIAFHRGARDRGKRYFGPFPSAGSVRESINLIQKLFRLRNCEDSYYAHRSRPCLQYQIRRCTAPCVGRVSRGDYAEQVNDASLFLQGKNQEVLTRLIARMEQAAQALEFESAALYRDQINTLKQMQAQQFVAGSRGDIDFLAVAQEQGRSGVQLVSIRSGRNLGQRSYFPSQAEGLEASEVLEAFIGQYYQERQPPAQMVISHPIVGRALLEQVFSEKAGKRIRIQARPRGERRKMVELAGRNAAQALKMRLASRANLAAQLESLQELLGLAETPGTLECFDISHTAGNQAVGSCVVFDDNGPVKSRYRRYNLKGITPGDDYAAMRQVLVRRYERVQAEEGVLPDLVVIDGGKGQLRQAEEVFAELGLTGIPLLGIAKGVSRRAGYEEWILPAPYRSFRPGPESPASHLVQQLRDEAHRFAITGHRGRRQKAGTKSALERIAGIGPRRRRALLNHFGGLQGVSKAGVDELSSVPGISRVLAEEIFRALH
ncbi:MAG: excinuclease ABC subunit UvrC [Xanthomonadales bacterium]|nr:excinuclease ABC subunit UvrC [Xanthomonadales bacterium]